MQTMRYMSTRGETPLMGFQEAVFTGLAPDGGLLIPESIPDVRDRLDDWSKLSFQDLAFEIMALFVDIPDDDLHALIDLSYQSFTHPEIAPAVSVGDIQMLELFHGPTLAFKDIALQFLGNVFAYVLEHRNQRMNILAATSGDTGSAAIQGVRGRERINIFVMHPRGRVAPLQEKQMTSVLDANVFNLAVSGNFDDCQRIMKSLFRDLSFKQQYTLGAVNSVNWTRVLAQIVYYFSAGLYVRSTTGASHLRFAVPTGNFGNILAGYYAHRMGLPIRKLILATNENDILARFFATGEYRMGDAVPTISPSMDIQVASNFERYLYYQVGQDPERIRALVHAFDAGGAVRIPLGVEGRVDPLFEAGVGTAADTRATIRRYYEQHGYLLDPHTAVGVSVGERYAVEDEPLICLATAHPAKFSQAIWDATGKDLAHHPYLDALATAPTRCEDIPADQEAIRQYIESHVPASAA